MSAADMGSGSTSTSDTDTDSLLGSHTELEQSTVTPRSSNWFIAVLSLSAGLGGFLFGYDTGKFVLEISCLAFLN